MLIPIVTIILSLGLILVLYLRNEKLKKNYKDILTENEVIKKAVHDLEMEQLKFQLQPHTLNNILANLRSISIRLNRGMDALSNTLEYILYKGKNHLVSVDDELSFLKGYLALNDLFLTEIDAVQLDLSEVDSSVSFFNTPCIPHLISAYSIENAFKHGDQTHPEFLRIKTRLNKERFEFEVINRIKIDYQVKEGGIGIKNMQQRLSYLYGENYNLKFSCNEEIYKFQLQIKLK